MNLNELRKKIAKLLADGASLAQRARDGDVLSAEEIETLSQYGQELRDLKAQETALVDQQRTAEELLAGNEHYTQPGRSAARMVPHGTDPGLGARDERQGPDLRGAGRRFVESEQFQRAMNSGQSQPIMRHDPVRFPGFRRDGAMTADEIEQVRALVSSGTAPASLLLPQVMPTIYRPAEAPLAMRDVLINGRTSSDTVTVMQEQSFTNAAAEVAEATVVNGSGLTGGVKPESALTFAEASFPVRTIAHWIPITRQTLADLPAMETYINERLLTGLERREDAAILDGNGTAPNLRGILNTSGIQALDNTYFTANAVANAGSANEDLNRLRRAKTLIRTVGRAQATFIVLNPADLERMDTIAASDRQYLIGGPLAPERRTLWGLPVVESENIDELTALVGDGSMAAVMDRQDAAIYTTDSHADFFIRNLFVILAEERLALPVFRPVAFAEVALTGNDGEAA